MYAHNWMIQCATGCALFELTIFSPPCRSQYSPQERIFKLSKRRSTSICSESDTAKYWKRKAQEWKRPKAKHWEDCDTQIWFSKTTIEPGRFLLVQKEFSGPNDWKHELGLVTKWSFRVVLVTLLPSVVRLGESLKRLTRDEWMKWSELLSFKRSRWSRMKVGDLN